jgi:hypothetical protein
VPAVSDVAIVFVVTPETAEAAVAPMIGVARMGAVIPVALVV